MAQTLSKYLEEIKLDKEELINRESENMEENKQLWIEAEDLKMKKHQVIISNSKIDEENNVIQKQCNSISNNRDGLKEQEKHISEKLQSILTKLDQIVKERQILRENSESIDSEHKSLKSSFETTNTDLNEQFVLNMKKSFLKLQENKVALMHKDIEMERKQKQLQIEMEEMKHERESLLTKENEQICLWNSLVAEYTILKDKKNVLIQEDEDLGIAFENTEIFKLKYYISLLS